MSLPEDKCILCAQKSKEDDSPLLCPKNHESWLTLLDAARVRQHSAILDIAEQLGDKEVPKLSYHRRCRSIFTMKRDLGTLKRKASGSQVDEVCTKRLCKRVSSEARVYAAVCIFCNKDKFQKGSKTRVKLTKAVQLRADQTLRECAIKKGDEKILAATSRDIVAAEAHYHWSCYRNYTRARPEREGDEEDDSSTLYQRIERESYAELFEYICSKQEDCTNFFLDNKA